MWRDKLQEIKKENEKYNDYTNAGATDNEIKKFLNEAQLKLGYTLPEEYLNFLKETNGVEFNGVIMYGIDQELLEHQMNSEVDGFIDLNEIWNEVDEKKQYIYFADKDISWYCYDLFNKKYVELDKPSGEHVKDYSDFYLMLDEILRSMLN